MKKFILALVSFFMVAGVVAQEHLTFKGIPVTGSMTEFCQKLKDKGFILFKQVNGLFVFSGDFIGRDVQVGVKPTDFGEEYVATLIVIFQSNKEWNILVDDYEYYKELYTRKYGKPTTSKEKIPALSDSNTALMFELSERKTVCKSVWKVAGGDIELSVEKHSGFSEGALVIHYRNFHYLGTKIQQDLEDI